MKSLGNPEGTSLSRQGCAFLALPMRMQEDLSAGGTKTQVQMIKEEFSLIKSRAKSP